MTDKEIEKALDRCKIEDLPCQECAYWHIATQGYNCRNALIRDVADYINRLKVESEKLKAVDNRVAFCDAYDHLQAAYKRLVKEKQQTCTDTVRACIEELQYFNSYEESEQVQRAINCLKEWAHDKYGVEVDDE